jgi:hypothetical protein
MSASRQPLGQGGQPFHPMTPEQRKELAILRALNERLADQLLRPFTLAARSALSMVPYYLSSPLVANLSNPTSIEDHLIEYVVKDIVIFGLSMTAASIVHYLLIQPIAFRIGRSRIGLPPPNIDENIISEEFADKYIQAYRRSNEALKKDAIFSTNIIAGSVGSGIARSFLYILTGVSGVTNWQQLFCILFYFEALYQMLKFDPRLVQLDYANDSMLLDAKMKLNEITASLQQESWKIKKARTLHESTLSLNTSGLDSISKSVMRLVLRDALFDDFGAHIKGKELIIPGELIITENKARQIKATIHAVLAKLNEIKKLKQQLLELDEKLQLSFNFEQRLGKLAPSFRAFAFFDPDTLPAKTVDQLLTLFSGSDMTIRDSFISLTRTTPVSSELLSQIKPIERKQIETTPPPSSSTVAIIKKVKPERPREEPAPTSPTIKSTPHTEKRRQVVQWPSGATYDSSSKKQEVHPFITEQPDSCRYFAGSRLTAKDFENRSDGLLVWKQIQQQILFPHAKGKDGSGIIRNLHGVAETPEGKAFEFQAKIKIKGIAARAYLTQETNNTGEVYYEAKGFKFDPH